MASTMSLSATTKGNTSTSTMELENNIVVNSLDEDDKKKSDDIILTGKEGRELFNTSETTLTVPRKLALESVLLKNALEGKESEIITVPDVSLKTLKKVFEFLEYNSHHKLLPIETPLKCNHFPELVSDIWYSNYMDIPNQEIFDLLAAANFMDIPMLLQLVCAKIASITLGKTPKEIRIYFNIPKGAEEEDDDDEEKEMEQGDEGNEEEEEKEEKEGGKEGKGKKGEEKKKRKL